MYISSKQMKQRFSEVLNNWAALKSFHNVRSPPDRSFWVSYDLMTQTSVELPVHSFKIVQNENISSIDLWRPDCTSTCTSSKLVSACFPSRRWCSICLQLLKELFFATVNTMWAIYFFDTESRIALNLYRDLTNRMYSIHDFFCCNWSEMAVIFVPCREQKCLLASIGDQRAFS